MCVILTMFFIFIELNSSDVIDDKMYRRARHVITENDRTLQAVKALKSKSIEEFGHLMNESHDSLRYLKPPSLPPVFNIKNLLISIHVLIIHLTR